MDASPTDKRQHLWPVPAAQACCSSKQELEFDREGRMDTPRYLFQSVTAKNSWSSAAYIHTQTQYMPHTHIQ